MKNCFFAIVMFALCICFTGTAQNQPAKSTHESAAQTRNLSAISVTNARTAESKPGDWYRSTEWLLVVVGCITFVVVGWQSFETRRAASATKDAALATLKQAQMIEASMKQWVELENWKSELLPGSEWMDVLFQVSNPTSFLLTPEYGEIKFNGPNPITSVFIYRPAPLGPKNPLNIKLSLPMVRPAAENYCAGQLIGFGIEGRIEYRTVFNKKVTQRFNGLLACSKTGTTLEVHVEPD